jgi:hypothetical protein
MKFLTELDVNTFLAEVKSFNKIGKVDLNYVPTNEEIGTFIKTRSGLVRKLKDSKKSSTQKKNWRGNRYKMMKGIKAFHKSTEGKRFHKRLGRFLATRLFRSKSTNEDAYQDLLIKQTYLKGLNAAKQHLFVELEYFHLLEEQADLELFITDHAIPMFISIEESILYDEELNEDQITFLFDILNEEVVISNISSRIGVEFAQIKKLWNSIVTDLNKKDVVYESENFYSTLTEKLKKAIEE